MGMATNLRGAGCSEELIIAAVGISLQIPSVFAKEFYWPPSRSCRGKVKHHIILVINVYPQVSIIGRTFAALAFYRYRGIISIDCWRLKHLLMHPVDQRLKQLRAFSTQSHIVDTFISTPLLLNMPSNRLRGKWSQYLLVIICAKSPSPAIPLSITMAGSSPMDILPSHFLQPILYRTYCLTKNTPAYSSFSVVSADDVFWITIGHVCSL
jgi:hypothetical protein